MAKLIVTSQWWEDHKPNGFKEKDLERALLLVENQQRALEKGGEKAAEQLTKAVDTLLKAVEKTVKSLDKKEHKDLISDLADMKKQAMALQRQSEVTTMDDSSREIEAALKLSAKPELTSAWWGKVRAGLGIKSKTLENGLAALENAHRGFERGAEGNWVKQIGDLQKVLKAGAAEALKEAAPANQKELAYALKVLLMLAQKDAKDRGAT